MPLAPLDIGFIVVILLAGLIGFGMGLGKVLKMIIGGFLGKLMAIVLTYGLFGLVSHMSFAQSLMNAFVEFLVAQDNDILNILLLIRIDVIVLAIVLFLLIRIVQKLLVFVVAAIMETDNLVIKLVNKVGGFALLFALVAMLVLIVLQIIAIANGVNAPPALIAESKIVLEIYNNNPFNSILASLKDSFSAFFA